jgi:hemerythrin-like domain-containing protein
MIFRGAAEGIQQESYKAFLSAVSLHSNNNFKMETNQRRTFIRQTLIAGTALAGLSLVQGCKQDPEEDVSPAEDLMREHGVLNRILLVYDYCSKQLSNKLSFPMLALADSAAIIRAFIEDYHEKLEEDHLFPRFQKANVLTDLTDVLLQQHRAGRIITEQVLNLAKSKTLNNDEQARLIHLLNSFNTMYRPHEAREDTVLFPALKKIISSHEYGSLGEDFEKKEHQLFGKDGFESMVAKVAEIEKSLGIYDLSRFTPAV